MKPLFLLLMTALLTITVKAQDDPSAELGELKKQRSEIESKISMAMPDPNMLDPELVKLQIAASGSSKAFYRAMIKHPSLESFREEVRAASAKLSDALARKDEVAILKAKEEFASVVKRRQEAAEKEPDLKVMLKASEDAATAYHDRRKRLLASHPSTKELAARLDEIDGKIVEQTVRVRTVSPP